MVATREWDDLSPQQQTALRIGIGVQIALAITAWVDLARRPGALVNGSKGTWAAVIAINFVGPIAYFIKGRRRN